jgi:RNA polymerase sigma-70 factor (ECF subfamily)
MSDEGSESELVERARAGDEDALSELLLRHGPLVRASLHIPDRWRSLLDPDEILQGAYYKAFLGMRAFEPTGRDAFRRWLSTLARNQLRDELKALETARRGGGFQRVEPTPSRSAGRAEIRAAVQNALSALAASERRAVELRELEGVTFERVAAELGCSATTARSLYARGMDRLAAILESASRFHSGPG